MFWRAVCIFIKALDKLLDFAVVFVCGALVFLSLSSMAGDYMMVKAAKDPGIKAYRQDSSPIEGRLISPFQAAWLSIDGTDVDFPVMQGEDNMEYLNKDPYGNFSLSGSIFLDYRNRSFDDPYCVVYGHHMEQGAMFGALDSFTDAEYFDAHRLGRLTTRSEVYNLKLFAAATADASDPLLFTPQTADPKKVLEHVRELSMIYFEPDDGTILALSTCTDGPEDGRLLLLGTLSRDQGQ